MPQRVYSLGEHGGWEESGMPREEQGRLVRYHLYIDDGGNGHLIPEGGPLPSEARRAPRWRTTTVIVEAAANTPEDQMQLALQSALAEWHRIEEARKRR